MKKHLLLLILAFAASALQAQNNNMYSLLFHGQGEYEYSGKRLMQQRDGDFIISTYLVADTGNINYISLGYMAYKVEHATHTVTDSLFIADTAILPCSFAQNPHGEGNIRTSFKFHEDCDSSFLHISFFPDNDFNINPNEDVVVPLCEGFVSGFGSIVDCRGDLIQQYSKERDALHSDEYAARIGLDGTLKRQTLLHENCAYTQVPNRMQVLKESPLTYYQWGQAETYHHGHFNLIVYVIDSLFHKNPIILNSLLSEELIYPDNPYIFLYEHFQMDGDTEVVPTDEDNDILVAAKYVKDTTYYPLTTEYGVVVAKYDLRTTLLKKYIVFNDYPGNTRAHCMMLKKMTDGTVYLLYKEQGYPAEIIVAVKMDTDLNVEWKRFCKTDNLNINPIFGHSILYKDELGEEKGIAWTGGGTNLNTNKYGFVFFLFNHDGTVGTSEGGIEVRPYTFYPNPVKEQLLMDFSPDVQPSQVELYDLQGRLVRSQSKALESIDMSQLPAGTYTMRVIMEDGMAYSDKVVKE